MLRDKKTFDFQEVSISKVDKILKQDLTGLREMLMKEEVTSEELVNVFGHRCYTIGRSLGLVTEEFYTEALYEARNKD